MGTMLKFPRRGHGRASVKPNNAGSARIFRLSSSRSKTMNLSAGMWPRAFQLDTAGTDTPAKDAAAVAPPTASITASMDLSMTPYSSRSVNMSSVHASAVAFPILVGNNFTMPPTAKVLGKRLCQTREALGLKAADICRAIEIDSNRWSQYENGKRRITMAVAIRLCEAYGLSLDWIYRGDPSGLPVRLHQKLSVVAA